MYKKIRVPAKYVDAVKQQQWEMLNPALSFYFEENSELP